MEDDISDIRCTVISLIEPAWLMRVKASVQNSEYFRKLQQSRYVNNTQDPQYKFSDGVWYY